MKKLSIVGLAMIVLASVAVGSSLSVPWFVDNAPEANRVPGISPGVMGVITLKSNVTTTLVCEITYYDPDGRELGPVPPNNTFSIAPQSALAFRPVAADPSPNATYPPWDPRAGQVGVVGGQEGAQGVLVPDRPQDLDPRPNGSATIRWVGEATDVQGQYTAIQTATAPEGSAQPGAYVVVSYAHLLPPGV